MRLHFANNLQPSRLLKFGLASVAMSVCFGLPSLLLADEATVKTVVATEAFLSPRELLAAGGMIGYVIIFISFLMVALIVDYLLTIRRTTFVTPGLAEEVHKLLAERKLAEATSLCEKQPWFLGRVLFAGLQESQLGFAAVEKAMEDCAAEQSARSYRRIEYLSVISTLAPMLGLMGTVWGDDSGIHGIRNESQSADFRTGPRRLQGSGDNADGACCGDTSNRGSGVFSQSS